MQIETSKNKTYAVNWCWAPVGENDDLMLELKSDTRPLYQIAEEFEGLSYISRTSETEGDAWYEGYSSVRSISRRPKGAVQMTLMKV